MARTNRNGSGAGGGGGPLTTTTTTTTTTTSGTVTSGVDALDNLNLDDMFADGGDDLFDELDMNLADMDDITGGGGGAGRATTGASSALQSSTTAAADRPPPKKSRGKASIVSSRTNSAPIPVLAEDNDDDDNNNNNEEGEGGVPRRRKTKRKSKAPVFYEDADDDYAEEPSRKKRKSTTTTKTTAASAAAATTTTNTAASPKKKGATSTSKKGLSLSTSSAAVDSVRSALSKAGTTGGGAAVGVSHNNNKLPTKASSSSKAKSSSLGSAATTTQKRGGAGTGGLGGPSTAAGSVAAAGQFGGRQKSKSLTLPTQKSKSKAGTTGIQSSSKAVTSGGGAASSDKLSKNARSNLAVGSSSLSSQPNNGGVAGTGAGGLAAASTTTGTSAGSVSSMGGTTHTLAQILATHPGLVQQSQFCGLAASNTLFYPFMPALPTEPTLKSRKLLPLIDRVHSTFLSLLQAPGKASAGVTTAREGEGIYQLLQEAYKDEKASSTATASTSNLPGGTASASSSGPGAAASTSGDNVAGAANNNNSSSGSADNNNKKEMIGNAVGALRKSISLLDKTRLAGDLYAVCALVKRQHDFLKQNLANMERWCRDNFPEKDYALIYVPIKGKKRKAGLLLSSGEPSILRSFPTNKLRIKVICTGLKDAKAVSGPLMAILPPVVGMGEGEFSNNNKITVEGGGASASASKTKKRKVTKTSEPSSSQTSASRAGGTAASAAGATGDVKDTTGSGYVESKPSKRRRMIADLLARTARELESTYLQRLDDRRQVASKQESELRTMIELDEVPVIHTQGMWRWLDKSGYFESFKETDIRKRLDGMRSPESGAVQNPIARNAVASITTSQVAEPTTESGSILDGSLLNRLIALLVEEDSPSKDEGSGYSDHHSDRLDLDIELYEEVKSSSPMLDLTLLTLEERTLLQLKAFGIVENPRMSSSSDDREEFSPHLQEKSPIGARQVSHDTPLAPEEPVSQQQQLLVEPAGTTTASLHKLPQQYSAADSHSEIEDVISAMTGDLVNMNALNNRRCNFVEALSMSCVLDEDLKRKNDVEATLIAKCQQLLKKAKETKAKNGKPKPSQSDELALPW